MRLLPCLTLLGGLLLSDALVAQVTPACLTRLDLGGGAAFVDGDDRQGVFEMAPRLGMLLGDELQLGPGLTLRTARFRTAELTGGLAGALRSGDGETGALAGLEAGYAWRRGAASGALVAASLGWGLLHGDRGGVASTTLYIALRRALTGPDLHEVTAGVSLGGGLLSWVFRLARM
jgi:hypothetical protein